MANVNAISAWQSGATGRGVTVSVVDSGIQMDHPDLATNISPLSTDIVVGRNQIMGQDRHGTRVSGVIAAPFNDYGTVGVAYNATILSIRADISNCTDPDNTVCFRGSDLARALDYAVANGAKVINLSLGGEAPLGTAFEAALARAIGAGVVFAIASGNEAGANPEWPGRYASDPRFAGGIIVTGAHNVNNQIAGFSNRAGVSRDYFLSAPGVEVITDCETPTTCWRVNGTSFAAPAVAGALALLLEAFPNLTGRQAVDILLRTGRDAGDVGADGVYGRGLLDIAQAFQPVGATTSPQSDGTAVRVAQLPGAHVGGAFGAALSTPALDTIAHDEFQRLFRMNLGAAYSPAPRRSWQPETPQAMRQTSVSMDGPGGLQYALVAAAAVPEPDPVVTRFGPFDAPWQGSEPRQEALLDIQAGRMSFAVWQGKGGSRSPFRGAAGDGFAALTQADHAMRAAMNFGAVTVTAETGSGDRRAALQQVQQDASSYARGSVGWRGDGKGLSISAGSLDERMGPLGAYMPLNSDFRLPSETRFAAVGGDIALGRGMTLVGEAGFGRTDIEGRFLSLTEPAISSTWRVGLVTACPVAVLGCSNLTWEVSQPLRIENGVFSAVLADIPLEYFDPVTFSERRFSAAPEGREINFALRSLHGLGDGSALHLEAVMIRQEQHRLEAPMGYALLASWRRGF
ncbi:peptidase S8 [Brevundimonas sp. S30B]|nr:peptidase S8 [Brevundimonas sp. MF30-B]TFW00838.1 peptidase S8 [Brevundimonas sp. S30B]